MKKEGAKFNDPSTYSKYAKIERQLIKEEKELKKLAEISAKAFAEYEREHPMEIE